MIFILIFQNENLDLIVIFWFLLMLWIFTWTGVFEHAATTKEIFVQFDEYMYVIQCMLFNAFLH